MEEQEKNQKHQIEEINKKEAQNILKLYPHKFNSKIFNKFLTKSVSQEGVAYNREEYFHALIGAGTTSIIGFAIITSMIAGNYKIEELGKFEAIVKFTLVSGLGFVLLHSIDFLNLAKRYYQEYEEELLKWDKFDWIEYQSRFLNRDEKLNLMKVIKSEFEKNQKHNKRKELVRKFKNKFTKFSS